MALTHPPFAADTVAKCSVFAKCCCLPEPKMAFVAFVAGLCLLSTACHARDAEARERRPTPKILLTPRSDERQTQFSTYDVSNDWNDAGLAVISPQATRASPSPRSLKEPARHKDFSLLFYDGIHIL